MKICFFGDIHGNVDALDACLIRLEQERADEVYCLGDLAGWLPFGDKTYARVRSLGVPTVAGNHDLLISGVFTDFPHQIERMQATAYNAGLLFAREGAIDYLLSLPLSIERPDFTVVHHSPFDLPLEGAPPTIECFNYLDGGALRKAVPLWRNYSKRLIFSGHDHVPAIFELRDGEDGVKTHAPGRLETFKLRLDTGSRYWVKAGSVGGPHRDGKPMVNMVLFDTEEQTITMIRTAYKTGALREALLSHRFFRNMQFVKKYIELFNAEPEG